MHVPHATNFYEKFGFGFFFCKKRLFQIKMAITFAYELGKDYVLYEKLSTWKVTSHFNGHFKNSKEKYESRKILDFASKNENFFFEFYHFMYCLFYFLIILKFLWYFGNLIFFEILSFKINKWIMHKDYLEFNDAHYYLIIVAYF
jgi:hypothetical protein